MLSMVPPLNGQEMIYYFYSNSSQAGFSRILAQSLFVRQYRLKVYENIKRHQRGGQKPRVWQQHREMHNKPTFRHVSTHTNMTTATTANTSKESHFITRSITTLAHTSKITHPVTQNFTSKAQLWKLSNYVSFKHSALSQMFCQEK